MKWSKSRIKIRFSSVISSRNCLDGGIFLVNITSPGGEPPVGCVDCQWKGRGR